MLTLAHARKHTQAHTRTAIVRNPVGNTHEDIDGFFRILKRVLDNAVIRTEAEVTDNPLQ